MNALPRRTISLMTLAAVMAAGLMVSACQADDSRPTRPRTENPFSPDQQAKDRAEQRALEQPVRPVPTGTGSDAPRQLNQGPTLGEQQVVLLQASGGGGSSGGGAGADGGMNQAGNQAGGMPAGGNQTPGQEMANQTGGNQAAGDSGSGVGNGMTGGNQGSGGESGWNWNMIGNYQGRTTSYTRDNYVGPLPHLPANPGSQPMVGMTPVPDSPWAIDHSWGQGLVLQDYPHRAWPEAKTHYQPAPVKHNPAYYYNIQPYLNVQQPNGSVAGDWVSVMYEVPWFYLNTAALPVLMVLEPPLAQRTTERVSQDPNYNGHLPENGAVLPTPEPGELRWTYPFLNPDGSVKERPGSGSPTR